METKTRTFEDFFFLDEELSDRAIELRDRIRKFGDEVVLPIINDAWEQAEFPEAIKQGLVELGIVGGYIPGYGCPGLSSQESGIVARELGRIDGSINTYYGVHSNLTMGAIYQLGSEEQRERWLPRMSALELSGAFALTEPDHGSDAVALELTAEKVGDVWHLNGEKSWIGNGDKADIIVVFARDIADKQVKAFVIETQIDGNSLEGFSSEVINGKIAKRAINQAHLYFENVTIPDSGRLVGCESYEDVNKVLAGARGSASWESVGHGIAAFEITRNYMLQREQFGAPLAGFQLIQEKLSTMLSHLVSIQLLCTRMSQLMENERLTASMSSLVKMTAARRGLEICREARDMLGGNGLLLENHIARHMTDMEVVSTYEGTDSIQALILGRGITGYSAFSGKRTVS